MQLKLDKRFQKNVQGLFGKYDFQVGVLNDGPHKQARSAKAGLGTYAGGPVRKKSNKAGPATISEVSEANRERMDVNYLTDPFQHRSSDIMKFTREFFKLAFGKSEKKRAENLLQAVVRNPILRGDYGSNATLTKKIKTFDRLMIDTGQLFKAIRAVCTIRGGRRV